MFQDQNCVRISRGRTHFKQILQLVAFCCFFGFCKLSSSFVIIEFLVHRECFSRRDIFLFLWDLILDSLEVLINQSQDVRRYPTILQRYRS